MTPEEKQRKVQELHDAVQRDIAQVSTEAVQEPVAKEAVIESEPVSDIEREARKLGWKSKEEREAEGKNTTYFVSPEEYVGRKPLFERLDKQKEELNELREIMKHTAHSINSIKEDTRKATIAELEAKRNAAVEIGDLNTFKQFDEQINRVKTEPVHTIPVQSTPNHVQDAANDFLSRNQSWYNENSIENKKMVITAKAIDSAMAQQDALDGIQRTPQEHLKRVEEKLKNEFPHRFENPKADKPNAVGKSTTSPSVGGPNGLVSKLTRRQREFGERFQRDGILTLEQYAAQLEKRGTLGK